MESRSGAGAARPGESPEGNRPAEREPRTADAEKRSRQEDHVDGDVPLKRARPDNPTLGSLSVKKQELLLAAERTLQAAFEVNCMMVTMA